MKAKTFVAAAALTAITVVGAGAAIGAQSGAYAAPETNGTTTSEAQPANEHAGETQPAEAHSAEVQSTAGQSAEVANALAALEHNRSAIAAQIDREKRQVRADLALPDHTSFGSISALETIDSQINILRGPNADEALASGAVDAAPQWFEDGYFESLLVIDWKCAWLSTGVAGVEGGDSAATAHAVKELHSLTSTRYADAFVDYDTFLADMADPLLEGDTSGALSYLPSCMDSTRADL